MGRHSYHILDGKGREAAATDERLEHAVEPLGIELGTVWIQVDVAALHCGEARVKRVVGLADVLHEQGLGCGGVDGFASALEPQGLSAPERDDLSEGMHAAIGACGHSHAAKLGHEWSQCGEQGGLDRALSGLAAEEITATLASVV